MSKDVEIRIRHAYEAAGKRLCDWPVEELDDLIHAFGAWGVFYGDDTTNDCVGQFRLDPVPHFEVIVAVSDD